MGLICRLRPPIRRVRHDDHISQDHDSRKQLLPVSLCSSSRLLVQAHVPEDGPQREVVGRFERSGQDERQPQDEQRSL